MEPEQQEPEQQFFKDPAIDRVLGVVFNLAAELQVLRDRVHVLELMLAKRGLLAAGEIDDFAGTAAEEQAIETDRREYVRHVLDPVLGHAASRSRFPEETGAP